MVLLVVIFDLFLKNQTKIVTKGKDAAPYATSVGTLEFNDNPRPRYMASITQIIPIVTYSLVTRRNYATSNLG